VGRSSLDSIEFQSARDTAISNKALIHVHRLDQDERRVHLKNCLGVPWQFDLPTPIKTFCSEIAAGNPADIAMLSKHMQDMRAFEIVRYQCHLKVRLTDVESSSKFIPSDLERILRAQFEHLTFDEQQMLKHASCQKQIFDFRSLQDLLVRGTMEWKTETVRSVLLQLLKFEILTMQTPEDQDEFRVTPLDGETVIEFEDADKFRFHSTLVRKIARDRASQEIKKMFLDEIGFGTLMKLRLQAKRWKARLLTKKAKQMVKKKPRVRPATRRTSTATVQRTSAMLPSGNLKQTMDAAKKECFFAAQEIGTKTEVPTAEEKQATANFLATLEPMEVPVEQPKIVGPVSYVDPEE